MSEKLINIKSSTKLMNKLLFGMILVMLLITNVSAQPPFTGQTTEEQIVVDALIFGSIKQNQDFTLHVHAFNATTGRNLTNATTGCAFHLYNSSGNHILRIPSMYYDGQGDWETVINKNNFTKTGSYALELWCFNGAATGGSERLYFEVTPNGLIPSTADSLIYALLLVGLTFLFFFLINNAKESSTYAWKMGYALFAYIVALLLAFISYNISLNYLYTFGFISDILNTTWIVMLAILPILIMIEGFLLLKELSNEIQIRNMSKYGYSREEAQKKYKK